MYTNDIKCGKSADPLWGSMAYDSASVLLPTVFVPLPSLPTGPKNFTDGRGKGGRGTIDAFSRGRLEREAQTVVQFWLLEALIVNWSLHCAVVRQSVDPQ